jgi:hypothetical protein
MARRRKNSGHPGNWESFRDDHIRANGGGRQRSNPQVPRRAAVVEFVRKHQPGDLYLAKVERESDIAGVVSTTVICVWAEPKPAILDAELRQAKPWDYVVVMRYRLGRATAARLVWDYTPQN